MKTAAEAEPAAETSAGPPPPEIGDPEGDERSDAQETVKQEEEAEAQAPDPKAAADDKARADAERVRKEIRELTSSAALVTEAEAEVAGRSRKGLGYTFKTAPRDQIAVARFFAEPIVLVPRAGLKAGDRYYYRLRTDSLQVEKVRGLPPLDRYHKIRNLFDIPYDRLTPALRALRRQVPNRGDIWVFGALIPPKEWAVVIARRREAVAEYNRQGRGARRTLDDVRNLELEYDPLPGGGFDIRVTRILFIDGTQWLSRGES